MINTSKKNFMDMQDGDVVSTYADTNSKKFPIDFMFELNSDEVDFMVSQNAIPSKKYLGGSLPLADVFKSANIIEKYGSGVKRVIGSFKEYGPREPQFETTQEVLKQKDTKIKILEALQKDATLTRDDLAKVVHVSANAVKQHLANLKKANRIKRVGSTKSGYWEVLDV